MCSVDRFLVYYLWFRYRWTKSGEAFDYEAEEGRISRQAQKGTLYVNNPLNSDEGIYQCFAENIHGTSVSNTVNLRKSGLWTAFTVTFVLSCSCVRRQFIYVSAQYSMHRRQAYLYLSHIHKCAIHFSRCQISYQGLICMTIIKYKGIFFCPKNRKRQKVFFCPAPIPIFPYLCIL